DRAAAGWSGGWQHASPCQASRPSLTATPAMAGAAAGSDHAQPNRLLTASPASSTADRYVQSSVCLESATALAEPSSRPARRWAYDSTGMITSESAARISPGVECSASPPPSSAATESTDTYSARAKKDSAIIRSARRSRRSTTSGSRAENCQATAAAEAISITESSPNATSAPEEATDPAAIATTASMTL